MHEEDGSFVARIHSSLLHPLLRTDGWETTLLALLILSAKQWDSDYPTSTVDVCSTLGRLPATSARPMPLTAKRVNATERALLAMLDYHTVISPSEFATFYLTAPWAYTKGGSAITHLGARALAAPHLVDSSPGFARPRPLSRNPSGSFPLPHRAAPVARESVSYSHLPAPAEVAG